MVFGHYSKNGESNGEYHGRLNGYYYEGLGNNRTETKLDNDMETRVLRF